jgi:hypothetical protein
VAGDVYGDWARWPELFPTTIRGVRELAAIPRCVALEIDHVDGRVPNVLVRRSPVEYELWEDKRRYTARFRSTFAAAGAGTEYGVDAWVSIKGVGRLLGPVAGLVVRARLRRLVLEPVRRAAERRWTAERDGRGDANAAPAQTSRSIQTLHRP